MREPRKREASHVASTTSERILDTRVRYRTELAVSVEEEEEDAPIAVG